MAVRRRRPEQADQRALFQHFAARAAKGVFACHVPMGGVRSVVEAAILKSMGAVAGVPDVLAIKNGKAFLLELKAAGGKLSPAQVACHARLEAAGAVVGIARGIDEALRWCEA